MYYGRVAYCPLVSHAEYAPRRALFKIRKKNALLTLLKKTGQTDQRTDGCQTVTLRLPLDANSVKSSKLHAAYK